MMLSYHFELRHHQPATATGKEKRASFDS